MSADAVRLVADVLRQHDYNGADLGHHGPRVEYCVCGWSGPGDRVHEGHQAAEVVAALGGLTHEVSQGTRTCALPGGSCEGMHHARWVGGWLPVPKDTP